MAFRAGNPPGCNLWCSRMARRGAPAAGGCRNIRRTGRPRPGSGSAGRREFRLDCRYRCSRHSSEAHWPRRARHVFSSVSPQTFYPKEKILSGLFEIPPERRGGPSTFPVFTLSIIAESGGFGKGEFVWGSGRSLWGSRIAFPPMPAGRPCT